MALKKKIEEFENEFIDRYLEISKNPFSDLFNDMEFNDKLKKKFDDLPKKEQKKYIDSFDKEQIEIKKERKRIEESNKKATEERLERERLLKLKHEENRKRIEELERLEKLNKKEKPVRKRRDVTRFTLTRDGKPVKEKLTKKEMKKALDKGKKILEKDLTKETNPEQGTTGHLKGHNFVGAGTKLSTRLYKIYEQTTPENLRTGKKPYNLPTNIGDLIAIKHDLSYTSEKPLVRLMGDAEMLRQLEQNRDKIKGTVNFYLEKNGIGGMSMYHSLKANTNELKFLYQILESINKNGMKEIEKIATNIPEEIKKFKVSDDYLAQFNNVLSNIYNIGIVKLVGSLTDTPVTREQMMTAFQQLSDYSESTELFDEYKKWFDDSGYSVDSDELISGKPLKPKEKLDDEYDAMLDHYHNYVNVINRDNPKILKEIKVEEQLYELNKIDEENLNELKNFTVEGSKREEEGAKDTDKSKINISDVDIRNMSSEGARGEQLKGDKLPTRIKPTQEQIQTILDARTDKAMANEIKKLRDAFVLVVPRDFEVSQLQKLDTDTSTELIKNANTLLPPYAKVKPQKGTARINKQKLKLSWQLTNEELLDALNSGDENAQKFIVNTILDAPAGTVVKTTKKLAQEIYDNYPEEKRELTKEELESFQKSEFTTEETLKHDKSTIKDAIREDIDKFKEEQEKETKFEIIEGEELLTEKQKKGVIKKAEEIYEENKYETKKIKLTPKKGVVGTVKEVKVEATPVNTEEENLNLQNDFNQLLADLVRNKKGTKTEDLSDEELEILITSMVKSAVANEEERTKTNLNAERISEIEDFIVQKTMDLISDKEILDDKLIGNLNRLAHNEDVSEEIKMLTKVEMKEKEVKEKEEIPVGKDGEALFTPVKQELPQPTPEEMKKAEEIVNETDQEGRIGAEIVLPSVEVIQPSVSKSRANELMFYAFNFKEPFSTGYSTLENNVLKRINRKKELINRAGAGVSFRRNPNIPINTKTQLNNYLFGKPRPVPIMQRMQSAERFVDEKHIGRFSKTTPFNKFREVSLSRKSVNQFKMSRNKNIVI